MGTLLCRLNSHPFYLGCVLRFLLLYVPPLVSKYPPELTLAYGVSRTLQSNVYALFIMDQASFMRRLCPIDYTFTRSSEYGSLIW
jgi:hypothetical protein